MRPMDRIILYSPRKSLAETELLNMIRLMLPKEGVAVCRTIEDFVDKKLHRFLPCYNYMHTPVAVILAANDDDLSSITSMGEWFQDTRIILILPDGKTETVTKGQKLKPRYTAYTGGNLEDVAAVLAKMLGTALPVGDLSPFSPH
jgi:hypothetical protein